MMKIGEVEYATLALTDKIRGAWRQYLIRCHKRDAAGFDKLYAKVRHLPKTVAEAMMREAVHIRPTSPTTEELLELAASVDGVRMLAWLLLKDPVPYLEFAPKITADNKSDVIQQLDSSNKKMSAEEAQEYLHKAKEQWQSAMPQNAKPI
jgi:hypothetical protein